MIIYKIESDASYKNLTGREESVIGNFHNYKGQALKDNWIPPVFVRVEDITPVKSEKQAEQLKNDQFDARCYGNILLVKEASAGVLKELPVELLPVKTEGTDAQFVFVNVLNIAEAINFDGLDNKQAMEMIRENRIDFIKDNVQDQVIFRDKKLLNFYYCTDTFIKLITGNKIAGLKFEQVGTAK